jgi:hypothetical protein
MLSNSPVEKRGAEGEARSAIFREAYFGSSKETDFDTRRAIHFS